MTDGNEHERSSDAAPGEDAPDKSAQAGEDTQSGSDSRSTDDTKSHQDERDPEVAEIEDDPSLNPENELLRDIKGG